MSEIIWRGHTLREDTRNGILTGQTYFRTNGECWDVWVSHLAHGYYATVNIAGDANDGQGICGVGLHETDPVAALDIALDDVSKEVTEMRDGLDAILAAAGGI